MFLDGDEVLPGDKLYSLKHKTHVTVKQVYADSIMVKRRSPQGREVLENYNPAGVGPNGAGKDLYWQDPVVVIPRKDVRIWELQKRMLLDMTAQIGNLLSRPEVLPPNDLSHLTLQEAQERGLIEPADQAQVTSMLRRPQGVT